MDSLGLSIYVEASKQGPLYVVECRSIVKDTHRWTEG